MSARRAHRPVEDVQASPTARARKVVPVSRPYMPSADAIRPYLERMDAARWYSNFGPLVLEFEARLQERFVGAPAAATAANGTLGLALALTALGVAPGQRCIMPSWTFVATAHAALQAGLEPWFADVDPDTMVLSAEAVRAMIAAEPGRVAAVVLIAPFGWMPELSDWTALQDETGVPVLVDGAAAFDSAHNAALPVMVSLHATKALGIGEGGVVIADDRRLIDHVRELSSFGFNGSRVSRIAATNAKLSEYGAAVGLAALDAWPATRLRYLLSAQRLRIALARTPEVAFQLGWGTEWVSSVCVVRLPDGASDRIEARLNAAGVDTRRWWSRGCHLSPAFADLPSGELTQTDLVAASSLGIPYAADMDIEDIDRTADALIRAIAAG